MSPSTRDDDAAPADPAPAPPTARVPRTQVRERILSAAELEFVRHGYRGASLAGIARRAGFTKGAVYSNFESKQSLLAEMLSERSERAGRSALDRLAEGGNGDADPTGGDLVARAADLLADEVMANREPALLLSELALHAAQDPAAARSYADLRRVQLRSLAAALSDHIPDLGLRVDADLDGAAFLLLTLMSSLAVERAADPHAVDRERIVAALSTVIGALIDRATRPGAGGSGARPRRSAGSGAAVPNAP